MMETQLTRKEKKAIYMAKYKEDHKEELSEKRTAYLQKTFVCSCGMVVRRNNQLQHQRSLKHERALEPLSS